MARTTREQATGGAVAVPDRRVHARGKLLKASAILVLVGAVYLLVGVWHRDTAHVKKAVAMLKPVERALQAALDASGRLPLRLPQTGPDRKALSTKGVTYLPLDDIRALRAFDGPVMVGYTRIVATGIRTDGRAVLVCDHGRCTTRWLPNAEFAAWNAKQSTWIENYQRQLLERGPRVP